MVPFLAATLLGILPSVDDERLSLEEHFGDSRNKGKQRRTEPYDLATR